MSVGAKRKHGRAAVAGGRHERVALCLKAAADRYHSRDKAMPGELAGDVGAWLRSVTLHRWFRVENEDVDLGPWGSQCSRVAHRMRSSEARCVGKECVRTGRFRWGPYS